MRKALFLTILVLCLAPHAHATNYFLATAAGGGSDANNGTTSGTPWLSPNHSVNCGDTITAAASASYLPANFAATKWGTVTCTAGNNVAWLTCATFDACKITAGSSNGMLVSANYWGVQGWEVDGTASSGICFDSFPNTTANIHHIIFANDIANGCGRSGFQSAIFTSGSKYGVDYIAIVGVIAYNAAQGSADCNSGVSVYEPRATDSLPGTHIYVSGVFAWGNVDGNPCAGGTPSDGEGILIDTPDGAQDSLSPYSQQIVVDNSILVANGGRGFEVYRNSNGSAPFAHIYFRHLTAWGDDTDASQNLAFCSEGLINAAVNVESFANLVVTAGATGCDSDALYAYYIANGNASDHVYQNSGYSAAGNNTGTSTSSGFSYGPANTFGANPGFANATAPGAPSCGSFASVPACMATVIANFTPTTAAAKAYGYQAPISTSVYDPLFPQWLCNVTNLPAALVTMGCLTGSSFSGTSANGATIH